MSRLREAIVNHDGKPESHSKDKSMAMTIEDVHMVYRSSKRVTEKQLDKLEAQLGAALPKGYRSFMTRFGHGWINDYLQFYCPDQELIKTQRERIIEWFEDFGDAAHYKGAKLKASDFENCIQFAVVLDTPLLFACPRFPGSAFELDGLDITQHRSGIEKLDRVLGMGSFPFAYFIPLEPVAAHRYFACQSKTLGVDEVVKAFVDACKSKVHVIDKDEGEGLHNRSPAFWLFPEKPGVHLHIYAVDNGRQRKVYVTYATSPKLLSKVETFVEKVFQLIGMKFKPAKPY